MSNEYQLHLKQQCRASRRENDKRAFINNLTHIILALDDEPEIKVMRLHTECGFGKMRAQELVYGKVVKVDKYIGKEYNHSKEEKYYYDASRAK